MSTPPAPVTLAEFDKIFESVKNWGRWGDDDELGTMNYITPETVRAAAERTSSAWWPTTSSTRAGARAANARSG